MTRSVELAPRIVVEGQPLPAAETAKLVGLRVERAFNIPGRATLRFVDVGYAVAQSQRMSMGAKIRISAPDRTEMFSGEITGVTLEQSVSASPVLSVVADDLSHRLGRSVVNRTFVSVTYSDVINKLAPEAALQIGRVDATTIVHELLMQSGTNAALFDSIAERSRSVWWVHEGKLQFRRIGTSLGTVAVELGRGLHEFSVRATAHHPTATTVAGWDGDKKQAITARVTASRARSGVGTLPEKFLRSGHLPDAELRTTQFNPDSQADAEVLAQSVLDDAITSAVTARGTLDATGRVAPGITVSVGNAGPSSGDYLVSEVTHDYGPRGFTTRFTAGPPGGQSLAAMLGRPTDGSFLVHDLVVGLVTNVNDPKDSGRVKVKFSALPTGGRPEVESAWARVLSTSAGDSRGIVFMPEVNDEVLVGFEGGDTLRPVVLGGLFGGQARLPGPATKAYEADGKLRTRTIATRVGHLLQFSDAEGAGYLLLQLADGRHTVRLDQNAGCTVEVPAGEPVTVRAGTAQFAITKQGDIVIEGNNVTIKALQQLQLTSLAQAVLKATGPLDVEGVAVTVKGTATQVQAAGALVLKGATVAIN